MNNHAAYVRALLDAERNPDGSVVHEDLVRHVAENLAFDADEAKLGKARRIVANRMKPGQTAPAGSVVFNGMEPYGYEPERLLADDEGNVIENKDAFLRFKTTEAERAQDAANRALARLSREQREANHLAIWTAEQFAKGRNPSEITWDTCVRETGLWKDADPETDDGEDTDEDDLA